MKYLEVDLYLLNIPGRSRRVTNPARARWPQVIEKIPCFIQAGSE